MLKRSDAATAVSKAEFQGRSAALRVDLLNLQYDLRQADGLPAVVLIAGDDRRSCMDVVETLHEWMDARYLNSHFFAKPTEEESERPRFWRYWRVLPRRGTVGVYVGAWAHGAVADRLASRIDGQGWEDRITNIVTFEQQLVDQGALVIKFWMHVSKRELAKRLKRARKHPEKEWRVDSKDWEVYENYDEASRIADVFLQATSRESAPWSVVRGENVRAALLQVGETLRDALAEHVAGKHAIATAPLREAPATGFQRIAEIDLEQELTRDEYKEAMQRCQARIARRTERAAEAGLTSVLVFEGADAAGKGGVIRRIIHAMDLRDYRVAPVAAPTDEEKQHHYLWRFWRALPRAGRLVVFDRSWYGRVLVERVEGYATKQQWQRAYSEINDFEEQLVESGYLVQKFWLHIDPDEQMRRFEAREETPFKKYKITEEDYRNRGKWEHYTEAADDMFARTDKPIARWHLVAANDKRWARIQVLKTFAAGLKAQLERHKQDES